MTQNEAKLATQYQLRASCRFAAYEQAMEEKRFAEAIKFHAWAANAYASARALMPASRHWA